MKSNELRIGNLVKINNDMLTETEGETYKVSGFNARFDMAFPDSTGTISLDHTKSLRTYSQFDEFIEPIELTEGWLLKFGFVFNDDSNSFRIFSCNDEWILSAQQTGMKIGFKIGLPINHRCDQYMTLFKYVHQLQNLYFALTGVELQLSST